MSPKPAISFGRTLRIGADEIRISYIRASGPGGQNVNKVASAAQLRFAVDDSPTLTTEIKNRLKTIAGRRINRDGVLIITARRHRSQAQNRQDALDRLRSLLERATRQRAKRVPTKPSRAAKQRRLEAKNRRGRLKNARKKPGLND